MTMSLAAMSIEIQVILDLRRLLSDRLKLQQDKKKLTTQIHTSLLATTWLYVVCVTTGLHLECPVSPTPQKKVFISGFWQKNMQLQTMDSLNDPSDCLTTTVIRLTMAAKNIIKFGGSRGDPFNNRHDLLP